MKKENIKIKSKCDNLLLDVMIFIPEKDIKGIVQFSHGMSEHKERYFPFMQYMTEQGYITIINDHRGHGKSIKDKEDLGYFYENDANYIVEDLHQITEYIKELYPNQPVILFGHSMGSMVVRKYIKKYDKDIDKLIVCGSPSNNKYVTLAITLTQIIQKIKGERHRSKLINNLAFGNFNKKDKKEKSSNAWVCANEETVEKYDKDELCGFIFTLNGFENLFKLVRDIYSNSGWSVNNKELSILFIAGSDDPVIINQDEWIKAQDFLRKIGYENIKNKLYPNLRHEILNEKNKDIVYGDILMFIEEDVQ